MPSFPSVTATYNGKPLEVLQGLIQQRARYMGEDTKDAAAAVGINVCQSLRADTRVASIRGKKLRIQHNAAWVQGWASGAGGGKRWMVARPASGGAHSRALVTPNVDPSAADAPVFDYNIDKTGPVRSRLIIAKDEADAMLHAPAVQRVLKHAGLAKRLWGVLMSDISGRARTGGDQVGSRVEAVARAAGSVQWNEKEGSLHLTIHDRLRYAKTALKGGSASIDMAMKKAANKVSGQLQQFAKTHWIAPWEKPISGTPFPDIVRRRKR